MADEQTSQPNQDPHPDAEFMSAIDEALDSNKKEESQTTEAVKKDETEFKEASKTTDSAGESIQVKTSSITRPDTPYLPDEEAQSKSEDEVKLARTGKTINPIDNTQANDSDETDDKVPVKVHSTPPTTPAEATKVQPPLEEPKPKVQPEELKPSNETPGVVPTDALKETSQQVDSAKVEPTQALKTFDTTKYHLPIKATKHHRQHTVNPVVAVLLMFVLSMVITTIAIDMEIIDIGVELPFDLF